MQLDRFCQRTIVIGLLGALGVATGCERKAPVARTDTVVQKDTKALDSTQAPVAGSGWNTAAGPVLLVQGETRDEAIVLLPEDDDSGAVARLRALGEQGANVSLFGRGGASLTGQLGAVPAASDLECRVWPLRGVHGEGTASTWAVGFIGGQTSALALDSVEVLSSRDSTALVAEASRLASMVTATTDPSFQGLRFTAHDIRRLEVSPGVQAIVAHLVRKVNQEANPQEEHTLLIAERDSGVTSGPYQLVYAERVHGLEEQSTTPEVIAAVRIAGRPTLIVARDGDAGVAYAMLERVGSRRWRIRWTSGMTRCG
ncbi:MAG: hypothetical protein ABI664_00080 [bacterium]